MKKKLPWFLVALLTLIVILILLFPGKKGLDPDKKAFEDSVTVWKSQQTHAINAGKEIIKQQAERMAQDSVILKAQDKEIYRLKNRTVVTRVVIQPMVDTIPALKTHLEAQDSLVVSLQIQSDTLKHALLNQEKYFMGLVVAHDAERRISERMVVESLARVETLQRQNRKFKRQSKLLNVGIVVFGVGGFFLGSQL
jgi:hypothetical protein